MVRIRSDVWAPKETAVLALAWLCVIIPAQVSGPTPEQAAWVKANAVPLTSVNAGSGFDDLEPLRSVIGDARIVGLGEATHGTREHFQMKHRLVEFLATQMGFTIFSIEASTPESYAVDGYVTGGVGDPAALVAGMGFWTWRTEEVLDMVRWMRAFNEREASAGSGKHIAFTGFDMQNPTQPRAIVHTFVAAHDPGFAASLDGHLKSLALARPRGAEFGVASASFPVEAARGKQVRFHGFIKTEGLKDGFAGLWWRVDGPGGVLAFDNMQDRGPRGTSDWTEVSLELPVAENASGIFFGVLMPGEGSAWFDDLAIEVGGEKYDSPALDLSFEADQLTGFAAPQSSYSVRLDPATKHGGSKSLRIAGRPEPGDAGGPAKAAAAARTILDHLTASRDRYIGAGATAKETDWAIQNARILDQWARLFGESGFAVRDESMAANVTWILDQNPGAKIILWAHNGHIANQPQWMGRHLKDRFGKDYLPIGFATAEGRYTAVTADGGGLKDHPLNPPPPTSVEAIFQSAGVPLAILDLRKAQRGSPGSGWVLEPHPMRSIGAMEMTKQFYPAIWGEGFEVLVYTEKTTPAVQLPKK